VLGSGATPIGWYKPEAIRKTRRAENFDIKNKGWPKPPL